MDSSYILFAVLMFVAVVLAFEGGYQLWASKRSGEAKRLAARLRTPRRTRQPPAKTDAKVSKT